MIRVGFIGFGRMGMTHFAILRPHASIKIAAICDQSSTMLKLIPKYMSVPVFTDFKKMIDEVEMDCVVISTPSGTHLPIVKYCVEHHLHVFVEKPFSLKYSEGKEFLPTLETSNIVHQVGYVIRFNEIFTEMKGILDSGGIGEIKGFSSEMHAATVIKETKTNWRSKRESGGGCLYELASHCIDLTLFLMGMPDIIAGSILQNIFSTEVEDSVMSTFLYNKGFSGRLYVNWSDQSYRKPTVVITVYGTQGKIIADMHGYKLFLRQSNQTMGFKKGWNNRYITDISKGVPFYLRGNEFTKQLYHFIDCIEGKTETNLSSFSEGLKTDLVIETIIENALNSGSIAVNDMSLSQSVNPLQTEHKSFFQKILKK